MIKKTALLALLAISSLNVNAQPLANLNSAMSVISVKQALIQKLPVMPYAGKDITLSEIGGLKTSMWNARKVIC